MTQGEIIAGRLKTARWWLNSVLERLAPEMLGWAPREGMRTIGGQLVEIIEVESQLVPVLRDGKTLTDEETAEIVGDATSLDGLRGALERVREQTLAYLATLSEADLMSDASPTQWYGAYWPKACPLGEHFRNIAEHEFYHAGQLMSYLWAKGDNPYDW